MSAQPDPPPAAGAGPSQESDAFEVHRQMVIALFLATLILTTVISVGLLRSHVTAAMAVAATGALGGFVSALRRLYTFQRFFPINFFKSRRRVNVYLLIYSMIPSLVGAIAAIALYLLFASELVKGALFPQFHQDPLNTQPDAFRNFVANWQPIAPADYAKALVWGFIAGFSERFVPDILDGFTSGEQISPAGTQVEGLKSQFEKEDVSR
jgi:hypothetical protein